MTLTEKLQHLPTSPGIYLMKDATGHLLYVGKAKNLKNRVSTYFHKSSAHTPKVKKLVKHLRDIELILTDTEFEAFMLECHYIKAYKPPYNRKMKNPQAYTYVNIFTVDGLLMVETTNAPLSGADPPHLWALHEP